MNIISSHKMFIISPSVTRAAVRGWFWVWGCSSDMSGCIHWDWYWYPGDCIRSSATSEATLPATSVTELRHRPRITSFWGSFCLSSREVVWFLIFPLYFPKSLNLSIRLLHFEPSPGGFNLSWPSCTCLTKQLKTKQASYDKKAGVLDV